MRLRVTITIIIITAILSSCKKDNEIEPTKDPVLNNFSILIKNNPRLSENIYFTFNDDHFSARLPYDTEPENLIASFDYYGSSVSINNELQVSGETTVDFTDIVTYDITNDGMDIANYKVDAILFTGLPIVNLLTYNNEEINSTDEYTIGKANVNGWRFFDNTLGDIEIRGRGHSTWYFHPKKPYQLKFEDKTSILGMPQDKKWIFLAEHSDKTLIRNSLAFEMGYMSNLDWTPKCEYAEVFINDSYRGTYNITQKVEESSNRVNIGEDGYLLEIDTQDHLDEEDVYFYSSKFLIQIKEPSLEYDSPKFNYIVDFINDFETILFGNEFLDEQTGYKTIIDVESFIDWYLINEIAKNQDARSYSSIYMNLIPGEKLKMGPLWDFDLGFGNVDYSECEYPQGFWVKDHSWINRMFDDPEFKDMVKERYSYFYRRKEDFIDIINSKADQLYLAQEENDNQWDIYGNYIWPNPVVYDSHKEEVDHLKTWLVTRLDWLDQAFQKL